MNVAVAKNETGRPLSDSFAIARDRLPGAAEARRVAFEAYERTGLPNRRAIFRLLMAPDVIAKP